MVRRLIVWIALVGWLIPPRAMAATTDELEAQLSAQAKLIEQLQQQVGELKQGQAIRQTEQVPTAPTPSKTELTKERPGETESRSTHPYSDLAAKEPSAVGRYFQKLTGATVGGYATEQFESFESANHTFNNQRFIVFVGRELNDRIRFYSEIEFEQLASIEADPADSRGGALEI